MSQRLVSMSQQLVWIVFESSNMGKCNFEINNSRDCPKVTKVEKSISLPDIHEHKRVAVTLSEGSLSFPHRLIYEDTIGVLDENKRLKAELFNIKLQLLSYVATLIELNNEKIRRLKLEKLCQSKEKKLNEQRLQLGCEKNVREKERQKLLMKMKGLEIKLKEINKQLNEDDAYNP
ncbi:unnamed protein product [Brugia timori]|uniref:Uncharacterized protein n=1 Tax=Brugia timori TaxID=42155 RepID=A0A0R3QYT5_9BILA|nr:unnamed protein product [Brugia timori]